MSYDEKHARWSPLWVALWVANTSVLTWLVPRLTMRLWLAWAVVLFLVPEFIGLARHHDALPPLTYVVRRYVPRWVPTSVTFGAAAWFAATWVPHAEHPGLVAVGIAAVAGWMTNHWDVTYDDPHEDT